MFVYGADDCHISAMQDGVSTLKFAYLESNIKLQFVNHIMQPEGPDLIPKQENAKLGQLPPVRRPARPNNSRAHEADNGSHPIRSEQERLETKGTLQLRKRRAAELEDHIRKQAEIVGKREWRHPLTQRTRRGMRCICRRGGTTHKAQGG